MANEECVTGAQITSDAQIKCARDYCDGTDRFFIAKCGTDLESDPLADETKDGWVELKNWSEAVQCLSIAYPVDPEILAGDGYNSGDLVAEDCRYFTSNIDGNKQDPLDEDGNVGSNWTEGTLPDGLRVYMLDWINDNSSQILDQAKWQTVSLTGDDITLIIENDDGSTSSETINMTPLVQPIRDMITSIQDCMGDMCDVSIPSGSLLQYLNGDWTYSQPFSEFDVDASTGEHTLKDGVIDSNHLTTALEAQIDANTACCTANTAELVLQDGRIDVLELLHAGGSFGGVGSMVWAFSTFNGAENVPLSGAFTQITRTGSTLYTFGNRYYGLSGTWAYRGEQNLGEPSAGRAQYNGTIALWERIV